VNTVQIVGRSSSHFTRVTLVFAHELGLAVELLPVFDMTVETAANYGDNPALKMPTLRTPEGLVFGAENICRTLADLAGAPRRVVWPEQLRGRVARNAQELVWHGMAAQVQLIFGVAVAGLPADNLYFKKCREGFAGALRWLDAHVPAVLESLPAPRDVSLFEVTLFCLVEHVATRGTMAMDPYPALLKFADEFRGRPSAQHTTYRFDVPPAT